MIIAEKCFDISKILKILFIYFTLYKYGKLFIVITSEVLKYETKE